MPNSFKVISKPNSFEATVSNPNTFDAKQFQSHFKTKLFQSQTVSKPNTFDAKQFQSHFKNSNPNSFEAKHFWCQTVSKPFQSQTVSKPNCFKAKQFWRETEWLLKGYTKKTYHCVKMQDWHDKKGKKSDGTVPLTPSYSSCNKHIWLRLLLTADSSPLLWTGWSRLFPGHWR